MKNLFTLLIAVLCTATVFGQRYAVIDTRYILDKMAEYKTAQSKVEATAAEWQKEIDTKQATLDKLYQSYDAEGAMMSADLKKKKEDELFDKEKELRDLQKKRFGFEGDLFKKRQELVKPVQDKVAAMVRKVASDNGYDLIFDKSEGNSIIFADPKLDISDVVLKSLRVN
ncbi:MAG: OmpH family outer membrane protein [Niabella sp.]